MTREEVIEILQKELKSYYGNHKMVSVYNTAIEALKQSRTAHWKRFHIYMYGSYFECDNCGFEADDDFNYCPNCGAKMEGVYREQ